MLLGDAAGLIDPFTGEGIGNAMASPNYAIKIAFLGKKHNNYSRKLFSNYIQQIINSPEKIIAFNLDGILEIFLSLESSNQEIISLSIQNLVKNLDDDSKKKLLLLNS